MRLTHFAATVAAFAYLTVTPVYAAQRGHAGGRSASPHATSPHATTTTHGQAAAHGQSATHGPATHGPSKTSRGPSAPTHGPTKRTSGVTTTSTTSNTTTSTRTGTTSGTTGTTSTTEVSPLVQRIQSKPQLASRIDTLLKGTGMTLTDAAAGFRNQGQFIAALHVAQNHPAIKFTDLRHEMIDNHRSLGQAVQTLTKSVDATKATVEAERQAEVDMTASSRTAPPARKEKK
jgi:hypothetical protein